MAEQTTQMLSNDIRRLLQRELGEFGITVFNTQLSELALKPQDIKPGDLLRLSQAIIRAVRPSAGDEKAQRVGKEIQKLKLNAELASLKGKETAPGNQRRLAELLVNLGNLCMATGDYEDGIRAFEKAIRCAKESDYKLKEAEAYLGIGKTREKENRWTEAMDFLGRCLDISEEIDYPVGIAEASRWMAHLHWHKSEYTEALRWLEKGLENAKRTGDDGVIGSAMIEYGLVYSDQGDMSKANDYYEKSIELVKNTRDYKQAARVYNNMGDRFLQDGDWKKALENFEKCNEYASMINNHEMIAWALFNSAEALVNIGGMDEAIDRGQRALKILEPLGEPLGHHGVLRALALAYAKKKDWDEAEMYFRRAEDVISQVQVPYSKGQLYYDWGRMYKAKGERKKAKELLTKAKKVLTEIGAKMLADKASAALEKL